MSEQEMAATRDELADAALKNYEELVKAAWPNGSSLSTIPQAIEAWRNLPALEAKLSKMEEALYNTIEEGVARAFINIDHDDKRARVLTQEEVAAAQVLAGESDVDCPNCDGDGFVTGSRHHPNCPGDEQFCMSHCPVPVQEWCETCGATGKVLPPPTKKGKSDE